jgi:hypothetical protein
MASCWVKIVRSDGGGAGDKVYVNANYLDSAGTIAKPFKTETGQSTFETLAAPPPPVRPSWRKTITLELPPPGDSAENAVEVQLDPVPPRRRQ